MPRSPAESQHALVHRRGREAEARASIHDARIAEHRRNGTLIPCDDAPGRRNADVQRQWPVGGSTS